MTKNEILWRLKVIGQISSMEDDHPSPHNQPWLAADRLDQDQLFTVQQEVIRLMLSVAEDIGDAEVNDLVQAFPWAYTVNSGDREG